MNDDVRYQVGDLVIDAGRGRVMRGEKEIPLPKLSFDLLLVLTRAAPNLLSIDALTGKVWPGLVISPETVSQRVKLLRDALGDDPKAPRYIAGLRGRGYQIIAPVGPVAPVGAVAPVGPVAPVEPLPVAPQQPPASEPAPAQTQPPARSSMTVVIAGLVVAALAFGTYFFLSRPERTVTVSTPFSPPPQSVAVLAFVNLSGDEKEEYFSDGLSEELVHALARIKGLRVAARTSSFSFKDSTADIKTVGRRLNVGTVLEGSVRKSGSRVRVTAQLINARDGYHHWSQVYDRELKDILAVQTEIASAVARTLEVTMQKQDLVVGSTNNPMAFDAYLRARHGESIQDEAGLRTALAATDEAVALDPNYADAHAFRGEVLAQLANIWVEDMNERARLNVEARASAEKAVAMAPKSGLAHAILGNVLSNTTSDYARIDAEYRRSIELEPGNASLLLNYASYAALFGRADALSAAKHALGLDPLSAGAHANLGVALFYARRHDEARAAFAEAARLGSNRLTVNWTGANELAAGRANAALPYCERDPDFWYDQWCLAMAYHKLDRKREATAMLEKIKQEQGDSAAYQYAEIHAYWGERRQALDWLAKAVEMQDAGLLAIKTDPFLDSLRDSPQFQQIVKQLDLPS